MREALSAEGFPKKVKIKDLHQLNEVLNTQGLAGRGRGESKKAQRGRGAGLEALGTTAPSPWRVNVVSPAAFLGETSQKTARTDEKREKPATCPNHKDLQKHMQAKHGMLLGCVAHKFLFFFNGLGAASPHRFPPHPWDTAFPPRTRVCQRLAEQLAAQAVRGGALAEELHSKHISWKMMIPTWSRAPGGAPTQTLQPCSVASARAARDAEVLVAPCRSRMSPGEGLVRGKSGLGGSFEVTSAENEHF